MAEVTLRVAEIPTLPMPALCARSGAPAHKLVRLRIVQTPWWAWLGLLGGLLVVLVLALAAGRRVDVHLPYAKGRNARRGLGAVGIVVGLIVTMLGLMAVAVEPSVFSALFLVLSAALLAGSFRLYADALASGRWVDEHHVKLTRLHPAFATALQQLVDHRREVERRVALAGWHPDPGGTHSYRWFDGSAWTEHVA